MTDRYQALRDAIAAGPTPGPRSTRAVEVRPESPEGGDFAIMDRDGEIIAEAFRRVGSTKDAVRPTAANAALMAAADPDTIRALLAEMRCERRWKRSWHTCLNPVRDLARRSSRKRAPRRHREPTMTRREIRDAAEKHSPRRRRARQAAHAARHQSAPWRPDEQLEIIAPRRQALPHRICHDLMRIALIERSSETLATSRCACIARSSTSWRRGRRCGWNRAMNASPHLVVAREPRCVRGRRQPCVGRGWIYLVAGLRMNRHQQRSETAAALVPPTRRAPKPGCAPPSTRAHHCACAAGCSSSGGRLRKRNDWGGCMVRPVWPAMTQRSSRFATCDGT